MAGEALESRFIIQDEASKVLENIAKQSDIAGDALAEVESALRGLETAGEVRIRAATKTEAPKAHVANEAAAAFDETNRIMQELPTATDEAKTAMEQCMAELEKELNDTIDLSVLEEINARNEEAWNDLLNEIEESSEEIRNEWQDAERGIVEIPDEAQREAEKTGVDLKKGVRGLGADIAGWWSIIKDVFGKLADVFGKLAEESDKLNTRIARFGLVADNEGKTGTARSERSAELYKQHQKFAQALGVQSEAFNETVLNMYSNGAGVVKSIEEAQTIAASSYMAMDIAGLRGQDKDAVMGEIQSMVNVGIADPDQIQESMKIAPNILRTIEQQWQKNQNGKALKLSSGEEITDATGKIATLAQEGQITAELVAQAMVNSAEETNRTWQTLPSTWEKLQNRIGVIVENMTFDIVKKIGEIADNSQVADLVMSAMKLGEKLVNFAKKYFVPVLGAALMAVGSVLTTMMNTINAIGDGLTNWQTAIPIVIGLGAALAAVAIKMGLVTKALAALKVALMAIAAHPIILIAAAAIAATLAIAHLVNSTQTGQELMLQATANMAYSFQQVAAVITNVVGIGKYALSRLAMFFQAVAMGIMQMLEWTLEKLSAVSDTAGEMLEALRKKEKGLAQVMSDTENWGDDGLKELNAELEANTKYFYDYSSKIPEEAAKKVAKDKDELKLTGFLEDIVKGQAEAPGTRENPAHVKGKVAIDGDYFDIIKRAAGVEIVNRYTTLRPTVNATFGDIHQMDAGDVIGELGKQIQEAEGAAISDAQALGA